MDSALLKSAIADAKAVRATALANASEALKEAFTPKFEAMFAEKLKEETADEESTETEVAAPNDVSNAVDTKDVTAGQPQTSPAELEEAGLTSEDLDEIIAELEQEAGEEPAPEAPAPEAAPEAPAPEAAPEAPAPEAGLEPDGDEAPVAPEAEAPAPEAGLEPDGDEAPVSPEAEAPAPEAPTGDEEIDLNELLNSLNESEEEETEEEEEEEETIDESKKDGMPKVEKNQDADYKKAPVKKTNSKGDIENTKKLEEDNQRLVQENKEYETAIITLRKELNEINLLNAKLLYTNKLFKEFSMSNDQKMKIVEAFDLTKNVREVKLTYAVMAESLNIGGNLKKKVVSATNITEGLASKPVASTKPTKEIISEGTVLANRFKKLAGIKG
jgi:hypothetical protein